MTKELRSAMREASKSLSAAIEDMADKVNAVLASRDMKMAARSVLAGKLRKAASRKDLNWQTLFDALCVKSRSEAVAALAAMIDPKGILTERERHILDIWPRFEDGELVMPGDKVHYSSAYNDETEIEVESITAMDGYFVLCDDECRSNQYEQGQRVKRPVQSVLDADGVEIEAGDTVYGIGRTKHRFEVIDPHHIDPEVGEAFSVRCYDRDELEECHCKPKLLTHTRPDSWKQIVEDMKKSPCAYFGFLYKDCDEGDGCPADESVDCRKVMTIDIIRRAEALAGIGVGE